MSSIQEIKKERLHDFLVAQIDEIYRYKWFMGEEIHYDPLYTYSMDDICMMWILNNAQTFRVEWIENHGSGYFEGDPDVGINNPD